jgi:transposase
MLRPDPRIERVYLHRAPVDMRRQIDGLSLVAKEVMQMDPMSGALFVFINARRNKLKLLVWERNGFVIQAPRAASISLAPAQRGDGANADRRAVELVARWLRCVAHETARSAAFFGV